MPAAAVWAKQFLASAGVWGGDFQHCPRPWTGRPVQTSGKFELMTIDVEKARADTPGADRVLHFNNAGAALMPKPVVEAYIDHIRLESEIGGYEAQAARKEALEATYAGLARLINGRADEIALLENATRAWDMAFYGLAATFEPGDKILTSEAEYASNALAFLQVAKRSGVSIEMVPSDSSGRLSVEALRQMLDDRARLIAVTHVPTNGGLVNPAAEELSLYRREELIGQPIEILVPERFREHHLNLRRGYAAERRTRRMFSGSAPASTMKSYSSWR